MRVWVTPRAIPSADDLIAAHEGELFRAQRGGTLWCVNLVDELHAIAAALHAGGVRYAICGGVAVTIHGATRSTKDLDLLVQRDDVDRVLELVRPLGYKFAALPMTFDEGTPRERHVQRVSKVDGRYHLLLDLLLAEGALDGTLDDALEIDLAEGPIRVVSKATLIRMKRLANRAQDVADVEKLEAIDG